MLEKDKSIMAQSCSHKHYFLTKKLDLEMVRAKTLSTLPSLIIKYIATHIELANGLIQPGTPPALIQQPVDRPHFQKLYSKQTSKIKKVEPAAE